MRKLIILFCIFLLTYSYSKAQYVAIPDAAFRTFLKSRYPTCFNAADMMDTTCSGIVNETTLIITNNTAITNIDGVQYFKNLKEFSCNNNYINSIPKLPVNLLKFSIAYNRLSALPALPIGLTYLNVAGNLLTTLPPLPNTLKYLSFGSNNITSLPAIPPQLEELYSRDNRYLGNLPILPATLKTLVCDLNALTTLPNLPDSLNILNCSFNGLTSLPNLPSTLSYLDCSSNNITSMPVIPMKLKYLFCESNQITTIPNFSDSLLTLFCRFNLLTTLPLMPNTVTNLNLLYNKLTSITNIPNKLTEFDCNNNFLTSLPSLPPVLQKLTCNNNLLTSLPNLPSSLKILICNDNLLTSLPNFPSSLEEVYCHKNKLTSLPVIPTTSNLQYLFCQNNLLTSLPDLPYGLTTLTCSNNKLSTLPNILYYSYLANINCDNNEISSLQPFNLRLKRLHCAFNKITVLPQLSPNLIEVNVGGNRDLKCLPKLNDAFLRIAIDTLNIKCVPRNNQVQYFLLSSVDSIAFTNGTINAFTRPISSPPICNPTNNSNQCLTSPYITGKVFRDINSNNIKDANEQYAANIKVQLKPNNYTYTNAQGKYELVADTIGAATLTITPPNFYNAVPSTVALNFPAFNTIINQPDIALQPSITKDSIKITLTPVNWAARPGFNYPYAITYENIGTTQVTANLQLLFNDTLLTYDSSSRTGVQNPTVNSLIYTTANMVQGQKESWIAYFRVKTTAGLNKLLKAKATASYNSSTSSDSISTITRGSYDPNDKQGTPTLTPAQVTEGSFIDYTVRFQNTGTDTAFTVVIADTLSSLLQANSFQMLEASHTCKTTVQDNKVYFEFFNILLPDSNVNKIASNGFVRFRVKPLSSVVNGNQINNKAAIYFDYNSPIITNTITTQISTPATLPLSLLALSAVAQNTQQILVYFNTSHEYNTQQFDIELSNDSRNFSYVGSVIAKGSGSNNYYATVSRTAVNNVGLPVVYIRLKMIDKDGKYSYSKIVQLVFQKETAAWDIVGNPAKDMLNIVVKANNIVHATAQLINAQGAVVKRFILKTGLQSISIAHLPAGNYFIETEFGTKKIMITK